jgi:hypothetical protein
LRASAPVIVLRLNPSRLLRAWWLALHAVLLGAAVLTGWPWWCRALAMLVVAAHGIVRRPAPPPGLILVAADGCCRVPGLDTGWLAPTPRTRIAPYWLLLSLGEERRARHDILLWVDQVDAATWARLTACLLRRRGVGTTPAGEPRSTRGADLR